MSTLLDNVDASWLRMEEPANHMVVTGVLVLDRPGDGCQQALAGSEVVDEHPVAGADRRGELAQAQVSDPGVEGMSDGGSEQTFPGLRCAHGRMYHTVHEPSGTESRRSDGQVARRS